jgi:hypothetical protein
LTLAAENLGASCTIQKCTIADNVAPEGSAIDSVAPLSIENCTIAANRGSTGGTISSGGSAVISSSTVYDNQGTGIVIFRLHSATVSNSLIAGNSGSGGQFDAKGDFISLGHNLIGKSDGSTGWGAPGDQVGTVANPLNPNLGPLQDNGGSTPTMMPLPGSKAIDQGRRNGLTMDQRGRPRPKDFPAIVNANFGDGSDIGAVEVQ